MKWISVTEDMPKTNKLVQVRIQPIYHDAYVYVGLVTHGMKFGDGPMPLEWRDPIHCDSKGRYEPLFNVTHWAPLLGPELM